MQNVIHIRSSYVHTFIDEVCLSAIAAVTDVGDVHIAAAPVAVKIVTSSQDND